MTRPTRKPETKAPTQPTAVTDGATKQESIGGIRVESVSDSHDWIKAIIFGDPFAGKTWLAGSASEVPEMSPVLVIDIESGKKTLREAWPKCRSITVKPKVNKQGQVVKEAWEVLFDVYEDLAKFPRGQLPYRTIVLDNMSEAYNLAMTHTINNEVAKAAERNRDRDEDTAEPKDYNITGSKFRKMIRAFRDLEANVIFTAWAREKTKDDGSTRTAVLPSLSGKMEKEVNGYFDEAWFIYVDDSGNRHLLTREAKKIKAKTRTHAMPDKIKEPKMQTIYNYVVGKAQPEPTTPTTNDTKEEGKQIA